MEDIQQQIYLKFIDFTNDIEAIEKDGVNPHFKSKYTTLDEIFKKTKKACKTHQVRIFNKVESSVLDNGSLYIEVTPVFMCQYGIYEGGTFRCISTNQIQNNGSVITYAKRYTLAAFLGVASDEDDDGNAGMQGVQVVNTIPKGYKQIETVATQTIRKYEYKEPQGKFTYSDMEIDSVINKNIIPLKPGSDIKKAFNRVLQYNHPQVTDKFNEKLKEIKVRMNDETGEFEPYE